MPHMWGLVHDVTDLVKMIALKAVFGDLLLKKNLDSQVTIKTTKYNLSVFYFQTPVTLKIIHSH